MPSIAKILALVLLGIGSLDLAGREAAAQDAQPGWPGASGGSQQGWAQVGANRQYDLTSYPPPAPQPGPLPPSPNMTPSPVVPAAYTASQPAAERADLAPPASPAAELPHPDSRPAVVPAAFDSPAKTAAAAPSASQPLSLSPRKGPDPLPLSAPSAAGKQVVGTAGLGALATTGGALGVVLGVFLLLAWLMRKASPRGVAVLPGEAFEVLGRAPLANRQQVHLLRCGRKLLLVCVTPGGTETLTEITDPIEVDRLAGLCQQTRPGSTTAAFREVFHELDHSRRLPEFPEDEDADDGYSSPPQNVGHYSRWEGHDV